MADQERNPNPLAKYGSVASLTVLGTAVAGSYGYTYTSVSKLKKEQAELTEKVLKLAEGKGSQDILEDKLGRVQEGIQKVEKDFSNLQIDMKLTQSRLELVEEMMSQMGFEFPDARGRAQAPYPRGYEGRYGAQGERDPPYGRRYEYEEEPPDSSSYGSYREPRTAGAGYRREEQRQPLSRTAQLLSDL